MAKPKAEPTKTKRDESAGRSRVDAPFTRSSRKSPSRTDINKSLHAPEKLDSVSPKATSTPRSPSRKTTIQKSSSNKSLSHKSPSRKSPSRKSPSRKSPSRKSPSRKSPFQLSPTGRDTGNRFPHRLRTAKIPEFKDLKLTARKSVKEAIYIESDSDGPDYKSINAEKPNAAVRGRARKLERESYIKNTKIVDKAISVDEEVTSYVSLIHRSIQKQKSHDSDRVVHLKHSDLAVQKLTEFSDEDEITRSGIVREKSVRESKPKVIDKRTTKTDLGEWFGALLGIVFVPVFIIAFYCYCNDTQCIFTKLPTLQKYKYLSTYINNIALLIYSAYILLVAFISSLPFGGKTTSGPLNKQGKVDYVLNGLFSLILIGAILFSLEYYQIPIILIILNNYFQLVISSLIVGVLFSVYLYVRSFFVPISALNPSAVSNSKLYNFWIGRELTPRAFNRIDVKLFLLRQFMIGVVLLNSMFIYNNLEITKPQTTKDMLDIPPINFNATLLLICTLQIIYAMDFLIFESNFLTTSVFQCEGAGYMNSVHSFTAPFIMTAASKYIYDYRVKLPKEYLIASVVLFIVGYFLYRASNSQKHAFRQNPYSSAVSHLESIPTSQGKKLLISGYWGFVRHPNYLGDILILISFAIFVLNAPPSLIYYADILHLIGRASDDGKKCKKRYGSAWDRYCQKVKYVLVPKIY